MSDEIYFTRSSRRYARIGDTFTVMTEGARVTIRLEAGGTTAITVAHEPDVRVTKRVVAAKPAAPAKPQAAARTAKPQAAARTAKPQAAARTAKPAARPRRAPVPEVRAEARAQLGRPGRRRTAATTSAGTSRVASAERLAALRSRASA